jgi:hypothetical protein
MTQLKNFAPSGGDGAESFRLAQWSSPARTASDSSPSPPGSFRSSPRYYLKSASSAADGFAPEKPRQQLSAFSADVRGNLAVTESRNLAVSYLGRRAQPKRKSRPPAVLNAKICGVGAIQTGLV